MQRNEWDLPDPPGVGGPTKTFPWGWIAALALLPVLAAAAFYVPVPVFYSYVPGPVRSVADLVDIDGGTTYSSEGRLLMTTVSIDTSVTGAEMIADAVDPNKELVLRSQVTGGQSLQQQLEQQQQEMEASKRHAREVALSALGFGEPAGDGAEVIQTVKGYPAEGKLRKGDVLVSVDGRPVDTTCDVGAAIDALQVGDRVTVTVRRDGRETTLSLDTVANPTDPQAPFIGVIMNDVNYRFDAPIDVSFDTGKIAGPSAGLMMALALYDQLTSDDLTGGRSIAGTGTISCDGGVGPIGGIQQKVAGAELDGADVFLAPQANAAEARRAADDIRVVAVSTFHDALEYLENLDPA